MNEEEKLLEEEQAPFDPFKNDPLINRARLGIEAEAFMKSSLGRYLVSTAEEQIRVLTEDLIQADSDDAKVNRDIRNDIHVCKMFLTWIEEAIDSGRLAEAQIRENEGHDDI